MGCPCNTTPLGSVAAPVLAQSVALFGIAGGAFGAAFSYRRHDWAAPGFLVGGLLGLGLGYALTRAR